MSRALLGALLMAALAAPLVGCGGASQARAGVAAREDRDPSLLLQAGLDHARAGDMVRAEQYLAAALAAGASEDSALPPLLAVTVASRHYRLALEYAEASLARNPDRARFRFLVGALYVAIGEAPRARELLEQAAGALPRDADVQFSVAVVFRDDLSDVASADRYFRQYLQLEPAGARAREARASLMEKIQ